MHQDRLTLGFCGLLFICQSTIGAAADAGSQTLDFNRDIKPILSNACYRCHGPDPADRKGGPDGLRLDTADGATVDLGGHAAIVPGKPELSDLIKRISSTDPDEVMPPKGAGKALTNRDIERLTEWIKQGAHFSRHWSYVKPSRPEMPTVKNPSWCRSEIDRFVLARLEREGLSPADEADRYALARRLSLDLTGLPPSLKQVDDFVQDSRPNAYESYVDLLLSSDAYGEHWGLLWLDLARYADSAGYADDPSRTIWLYRDYVIKSFNANKPFDQFTVEQVAGDLLPNPNDDQLIGTAFHRNTLTNNEGGTNDEEFRNVAVVDRVNTTMAVWMGTTVACAQCHTHKYDPITQEDYFRLFAFFNNTEDADRGDEAPLHSVLSPELQHRQSDLQSQIAKLEQTLKNPTPDLTADLAKWDTDFPRNVAWKTIQPSQVKTRSNVSTSISEDGSIKVAAGAANDVYTIDLTQIPAFRAMRIDALTDKDLPGTGPGHEGGNFVITKLSALVTPPAGSAVVGRYVRIELPGDKYLSLAEVQVFSGSQNIALSGEARQISTDFQGDARRAIDGNTNGHYYEANSTTHTAAGKDPWWEVDLKVAQTIDRVYVWNRTDGAGERLANYRVIILNEQHQPIWQEIATTPPNPSSELSVNGQRAVAFRSAIADYAQSGFEPGNVLNNKDPKTKGWAVAGATGKSHALTLVVAKEQDIPAGAKLQVVIEQESNFANHTLGKCRISFADQPGVAEWASTPAAVVSGLQLSAADRSPEQQQEITQYFLSIAPRLTPLRDELASLRKSLGELKPDTVPVMKEIVSNRRITKLQHRGNFMDLGQDVSEGTPAALFPLSDGAPRNRLGLAKWLIDQDNPLTARVIANRYWEQLFGIGLVSTSEEFGSQGDQPSHPELLDWLACELSGAGTTGSAPGTHRAWDTKLFLKSLVMSSTYRQSSKVSPEVNQRDPDNRLLARGPRFRLSAETLRDQALFVSGLLSPKMFGPPVKPPQPNLGLSAAFGGSTDWQTSPGEDKYRRGVYTTWRRSNPYPSMATFDAPNREVCTVRRVRTNTPLQALVTLNDPVYVEAAQSLARRLLKEGGLTAADRASYGFRLVLARSPHENERNRLVSLYEKSLVRYSQNADDAKRMATEPLGAADADTNLAELAAWTVVSNVLLNLDETLMKR